MKKIKITLIKRLTIHSFTNHNQKSGQSSEKYEKTENWPNLLKMRKKGTFCEIEELTKTTVFVILPEIASVES